ncbi:MAG: uracil-DNA glycosylase [Lachnospiraceae bacterium]|nr:uracil-DNA glycosylase [Lachnospiraceae bacterium]
MSQIINDWLPFMKAEFGKDYYKNLYSFIVKEYQTQTVYPPKDDVLRAFNLTPLSEVKVVILGQDPYHEPGQAHGLSFSVQKGIPKPPSLENIYKELNTDLGCSIPESGDLTYWAEQGVLLLNSLLTVRAHQAFSHKGKGWEEFTDAAIKAVASQDRPIVYILWGSAARSKKVFITNPKHLVIESAHPSPLSAYRGFFGSRPFSKCNEYLSANGITPIDWQIRD